MTTSEGLIATSGEIDRSGQLRTTYQAQPYVAPTVLSAARRLGMGDLPVQQSVF